MEARLCKNCRRVIPETMRIDAVFCSAKCGWTYRNQKKRKEYVEKQKPL
jgi:predicted nucleic acid-binding Zn ribbon protein